MEQHLPPRVWVARLPNAPYEDVESKELFMCRCPGYMDITDNDATFFAEFNTINK